MKTIAQLGLTTVVITTFFFSCKKADASIDDSVTTSANTDTISTAVVVGKKEENRKFIRTADLKFKVKNVAKSTYAIENATHHFGGFVTYTNLQSTVTDKLETKISQDSTLETTKYSVANDITIRVPNAQLDTVIKTIAKQIAFLDYRVIKADDVSLKVLSNQLSQERSATNEKRIEKAIDTKGKKLTDVVTAETDLATQKEQNDATKIENLSLQDQVNFSTLTLQLYQRDSVQQEIVANEKDANSYQPQIGLQLLDSLKSGWYVLQNLIVFVFQLWWFIALSLGGFFIYRKYGKNKV